METAPTEARDLVELSKLLARRLLAIGENRFELLMVEVQEERERLLHAILLALGVAAFGLLAGVALTGAIVVLLWEVSRVAALLVLTCLYGATAVCLSGDSPESFATGSIFRLPSINSERTGHVWKSISRKPARIAEATVDRGE